MKIFDPLGMDAYELAHPVNSEDFRTLRELLSGVPQRATWVPIHMEVVREEWDGQPFLESDAPYLGSSYALVFRPRAVEVMSPLLEPYGEFLPLVCTDAELRVFNCTRAVPALDEAASVLWRDEGDGRITHIVKHVFHPEVIRGLLVFKLTNIESSSTYVNEEFVARWTEAGLRGLTFPQVWEG
ncbi:MAG TPA: DUF1629 domain-containing protein [Myxococcus sp.]|nr:DUF1629 domain-containing protein [Myxococcus sp.]